MSETRKRTTLVEGMPLCSRGGLLAAAHMEGEAFSKRLVHNEPGVTEIHLEARSVLRDGPMRVECWWSDEDSAYIARLTDTEEAGRPFSATHTGIGTTREEAIAHLAVAEYVLALAVAAPPAPVRVTEGILGPRIRALAIVQSEISDAIAAHDSGENVDSHARARHVLDALAAPPAPVRVTEATDNVRRAAVGMAMMARDAMGSGKYTKACDDFDAALSALTAALSRGREG